MFNKLSVSKYYMDCIDLHGNVFIGYVGRVTWQKFNFFYSNYLYLESSTMQLHTDYATQTVDFPQWSTPQFRWSHPALKIAGQWKSLHAPVGEQNLLNDTQTNIQWHCLQPLSESEVWVNKKQMNGLGYTEYLNLNLNPFDLPFANIRWGHFTAENTSLVWIQWVGKVPLTLVSVNGVIHRDALITDTHVEINSIQLRLDLTDSVALRKGSLLDTVFQSLRWLTQFFPLKMLATQETKWRSKGCLTNTQQPQIITHGWAIHELVLWQ